MPTGRGQGRSRGPTGLPPLGAGGVRARGLSSGVEIENTADSFQNYFLVEISVTGHVLEVGREAGAARQNNSMDSGYVLPSWTRIFLGSEEGQDGPRC